MGRKLDKLPSLELIAILLGIPIQILYEIYKFYSKGLQYKRFANNLKKHIEMSVIKKIFAIRKSDVRFFTWYKAKTMLRLNSLIHPKYVKTLPNYAKDYDSNSFWLVKQENRLLDDPIIIHLHGGAYSWQFAPSHLSALLSVYELLQPEKRNKTSILILDYGLVSQGYTFPAQRVQLHETYTKLTQVDHNTNILFLGDSCGGHLAVVYTQCLKSIAKHDTEKVVYPNALLLVSPWLDVLPDEKHYQPEKSYYENEGKDILSYHSIGSAQVIMNIFGNSDISSPLVSPLLADFSIKYWNDIPTLKKDTLVIVGENEVFRDDALDWSEKLFDCNLLKDHKTDYNNSKGIYDPSIYSFHSPTAEGKFGAVVHVEPYGIHDSTFVFESDLIDIILKKKRNYYSSRLEEIDQVEYFGIIKIVEYLNTIL